MIKKVNVSGNEYMLFVTESKPKGYKLSVVTTADQPYRIIRNKQFPKDTSMVDVEVWAMEILSQIKN